MTVFGIIFFSTVFIGLLVLITYNDVFFGGLFTSTVVTAILVIIFILLGSINTKYEKSKVFGVTYIKSITLNSKINGNFTLGCGTVEETDYYYFVVDTDMGYQISRIQNTPKTYIKEDENNKPFIEFTHYYAIKINWFGKLFFKNNTYNKDGEIIIHVPQNTVVKKYNIDTKDL